MKERGIIFTAWSISKIIDRTKTQTRRTWGLERINKNPDNFWLHSESGNGLWIFDQPSGELIVLKCPYGQVGDRLRVNETWALTPEWDDGQAPCEIADFLHGAILYKADMDWETDGLFKQDGGKWRSSRFMPRWASRINLEITNLRAERLQDITEEDAIAEGCDWGGWTEDGSWCTAKFNFEWLWDSLNPKYPWDFNPWVWSIGFKVI